MSKFDGSEMLLIMSKNYTCRDSNITFNSRLQFAMEELKGCRYLVPLSSYAAGATDILDLILWFMLPAKLLFRFDSNLNSETEHPDPVSVSTPAIEIELHEMVYRGLWYKLIRNA